MVCNDKQISEKEIIEDDRGSEGAGSELLMTLSNRMCVKD